MISLLYKKKLMAYNLPGSKSTCEQNLENEANLRREETCAYQKVQFAISQHLSDGKLLIICHSRVTAF